MNLQDTVSKFSNTWLKVLRAHDLTAQTNCADGKFHNTDPSVWRAKALGAHSSADTAPCCGKEKEKPFRWNIFEIQALTPWFQVLKVFFFVQCACSNLFVTCLIRDGSRNTQTYILLLKGCIKTFLRHNKYQNQKPVKPSDCQVKLDSANNS